jgi:DIE2/ALG10 family
MILPRWPPDFVRLLYSSFLEKGTLTLAIPFPVDVVRSIPSVPVILLDILQPFIPYALTPALFSEFVIWNGGIALGTYSAVCSLCSDLVY